MGQDWTVGRQSVNGLTPWVFAGVNESYHTYGLRNGNTKEALREQVKTIDTLLARSVPVRTYYSREIAERLSKFCDEIGYSFSTITNAAVKMAMQNSEQIFKDAKGVRETRWQSSLN